MPDLELANLEQLYKCLLIHVFLYFCNTCKAHKVINNPERIFSTGIKCVSYTHAHKCKYELSGDRQMAHGHKNFKDEYL